MNQERIILERKYDASIDELWDLWTTKEGIDSWWGPEGFSVKARSIDLRAGGTLHYTMVAAATPQIEFMVQHGIPLVSEVELRFAEVMPKSRFSYDNLIDFVPGVNPYSVKHTVEFFASGDKVCLRVTLERMHTDEWTSRAVLGWESELGKLDRFLANRDRRPDRRVG